MSSFSRRNFLFASLMATAIRILLVFGVMIAVDRSVRATDSFPRKLRRPVALAFGPHERTIYVANQCGSVSVLDAKSRRVTAEFNIAKRLSDLVAGPRFKNRLYAVDEQMHQLLVIAFADDGKLRVEQRIRVPATPVSISIDPQERWIGVASLWARQLAFVDLKTGKLQRVIDLPFAPRLQLLLPAQNELIVADSHGGKLALIDVERRQLTGIRELEAHNIRGLDSDGTLLHISHQILNANKETSSEGVHWGGVMVNVARSISLKVLREDPKNNFVASLSFLGLPDYAAGDPAGIAVTSGGKMVVAYAGMNEVAIGQRPFTNLDRVPVGKRPTIVKLTQDQSTAYVVNTFDDSVSVVDVQSVESLGRISLGPKPLPTVVQRGEHLFYNSRLASDGWFSCHSCHTDGHTNGLLNDNLSDRTYGAPKRVPSLLGTRHAGPWAWNGAVTTLEQQIKNSVEKTMQGLPLEAEQVTDLAAYLRTLEPPPSADRLREQTDSVAIGHGKRLFREVGCVACHAPPTYTSAARYDVGIHDEHGLKEFNPPSLLGVGQRAPYFHDNRAATLIDVLGHHAHGADRKLSMLEQRQLRDFLRSLENARN
ncbi:MAG: cytochrome C peroxidase [Planctomycetota bacterium]|nr:cytochrome C peroxidase [Planctomycetota bacterium]